MERLINTRIRGWMNYYCKFHKWTTTDLWRWVNRKLIEWTMANKRIGKKKAIRWLESVFKTKPNLLVHWTLLPPVLGKTERKPNFGSAV